MAKDINEIILGACDVYMYEYTGLPNAELPAHGAIETAEHNVGHCSAGFSIDYKPTKYDVKNQYGTTVKSFITKEEITAKTGILSWDLKNLMLLSTASFEEDSEGKKRTLTFSGKGKSLKTVLIRAVHEKENGKKIRFTMIGSGGNGFVIEFGEKELTIDAEITAINYKEGFLASFEEEI